MKLKNKKIYVLFAVIGVCFLTVLLQIIVYNAFPSLNDSFGDEWYEEIAIETAFAYIREIEENDGELKVIGYSYHDYDQKIVEENCVAQIKNYPFSKMKLVVESRNWEYTVDLAVDENGELQAVSLEKEKNYNPFLK